MENIFFAEGKHGKIYFCTFFISKKNKKWKNIFCRSKTWKNKFLHFSLEKITSNAPKVVCIVLAGGHSETLGDYLLL